MGVINAYQTSWEASTQDRLRAGRILQDHLLVSTPGHLVYQAALHPFLLAFVTEVQSLSLPDSTAGGDGDQLRLCSAPPAPVHLAHTEPVCSSSYMPGP